MSNNKGICPHCGGEYGPTWSICPHCSRPLPTLDELRAKYHGQVAETQREIRESSKMTGEDMTLRVGGPTAPPAQPVGQGSGTPERNGSFLDKWGACKVCDGEIPQGHAPHCDIYKLEQEVTQARTALATVTAEREEAREALNAANEHAVKLEKSVWESGKEIAALRASAERARKDGERLDLLEAWAKQAQGRRMLATIPQDSGAKFSIMNEEPMFPDSEIAVVAGVHDTIRAAIDAARLTSEGGK